MKIYFVNYRRLYPNTQAFNRWFVFERFWKKRLWCIGIKRWFVKLDFRKDWVADMKG